MVWSGSVRILVGFLIIHYARGGLVSSPFDNFRIECPHSSGAQRLSIRMVESQGMKRQDTVFAISCNSINEIYPWNGIPPELAALDREECRYSSAFDPIMDSHTELSCGPREYLASVVRLYGTKIQIGCCKMRTREEANCVVQKFAKPFGMSVRTEIENRAMLINAISVDGSSFLVRFCDLEPRAAGLIEEDAKKILLRNTTTTLSQATAETATTIETTTLPTTSPIIQTSGSTTESTSPKKIIKVKQTLPANLTRTKSHDSQVEDGNVDDNEITLPVQRSLHGISIVDNTARHKAKDVPRGLAKLSFNDSSTPVDTTTVSTESIITENTTRPVPSSTKQEVQTKVAQPVEKTTVEVKSTTKQVTDISSPSSIITTEKISTRVNAGALTKTSTTESPAPTTAQTESVSSTTHQTGSVSTTTSPTDSSSVRSKAQFIATDGHNTETMFPKMPIGDYDNEKEERLKKEEPDKIAKSILKMIDARKEIKKLTKEIEQKRESTTVAAGTRPSTHKVTEGEISTGEEVVITTPSVLVVSRRGGKRPMNDGSVKVDENKPDKRIEVVQSDQTPLPLDRLDRDQKRVDEHVDQAPFDFSAFPQAPPSGDNLKQAPELPRSNRIQSKSTTKTRLVSTTTNEPEYLVEDKLDDVPEPISLKPRRNLARTSALRRRPVSPYVDEETNSSPFDENDKDEQRSSGGHRRKTDSTGLAAENFNHHDLFDSGESYEQASEGRFSLPADSRFSQRSPFEIRRAPNPHLREPDYFFDIADKYATTRATRRPQSEVDILFETPTEEDLMTHVSHRDAERYFVPQNNKPMKAPEPPTFEHERRPTRLTFLRKKQHDSMKTHVKHPLPDPSNQLVPMSEASSQPHTPATVALPPIVPVTRARSTTTTKSTTLQSSTIQDITSTPTMTVVESSSVQPSTESSSVQPSSVQPSSMESSSVQPSSMESSSVQPSTAESSSVQPSTAESSSVQPSTAEPSSMEPATESSTKLSTELLTSLFQTSSTKVYNPLSFYHTIPPRRQFLREKILTFCSKDTAIRDENSMVIACGTEEEIWLPTRCPEGTDCFISSDSLYRICCPVASQ